jgi:Zn ribbon nucleic-acid-binding protein
MVREGGAEVCDAREGLRKRALVVGEEVHVLDCVACGVAIATRERKVEDGGHEPDPVEADVIMADLDIGVGRQGRWRCCGEETRVFSGRGDGVAVL